MENYEFDADPNTVLVYGSLRRDCYNNSVLDGATYLRTFTTKPVWQMYDLGSFPAVCTGDDSIVVEEWAITPEILARLDCLEGYNPENPSHSFYSRIRYMGRWMYMMQRSELVGNPIVKGGDWRKYYGHSE